MPFLCSWNCSQKEKNGCLFYFCFSHYCFSLFILLLLIVFGFYFGFIVLIGLIVGYLDFFGECVIKI